MAQPEQKYVTAFEGILTAEELQRTTAEIGEFSDDLPPLKGAPALVRHTIGRLPDSTKEGMIASGVKVADKKRRDYSSVTGGVFDPAQHKSFKGQPSADGKEDYVSKLNYQTFTLSRDGQYLSRTRAQAVTDLFPYGQEKTWPTLVLVSNGNLVSPQSFFDSFQAAQQIIPAVTDTNSAKMVVAGTYFSQRHLHANAQDTFSRYRELGVKPRNLDKITPAAEVQAYLLLDLLLKRTAEGKVETEEGKPIIRRDAPEVLRHIIGYGYSGGHMTNKDAFRLLRNLLASGDVRVEVENYRVERHDSTEATANRLIPIARLVGVAGMDRMEIGAEYGMPKEVDFVSPADFSHAFSGPRFLRAENVIQIAMRDDKDQPIKDLIGNHAQESYVRAILSRANSLQLAQAHNKLGPKPRSL